MMVPVFMKINSPFTEGNKFKLTYTILVKLSYSDNRVKFFDQAHSSQIPIVVTD